MSVTLIVLGGNHHGRRIPIRIPEFCIGRDPSCHLRPASKDVQWEHCAILTRASRSFLRDNGGPGGTLLNRRLLVGGEMQLQEGDVITVGPLNFQVALDHDDATFAVTSDELPASDTDTNRLPVRRAETRAVEATHPTAVLPFPTAKRPRDCREILCSEW